MKKIFTLDDFIVAGTSGISYGLGFKIPQILGYEEWQCVFICLLVGFALDKLTSTIVFSKIVQSSKTNRILAFSGYILVCTTIEYAFMSWKEISIDNCAIEGYAYMVVPAILGFAFSMVVCWYRIWKIHERYGDGSDGFVFDDQLKKSDIEEFLSARKRRIQFFSLAFLTQKLLSALVAGKLLSRCPNRKMSSRQNISARPQFKSITKVHS